MKIFVTGYQGFIGSRLVHALILSGHTVSISNVDICSMLIDDSYDRIYHLAAISRIPPSYKMPQETMRVNVQGTLNIIRQASCPVVLASTTNEGPSPYTVSKRAAEYCMRPTDHVLQIANVYGPGGEGVVDVFKQSPTITVRGGTQQKDFVHVDDVVFAMMNIKPGVTCVCSEKPISLNQLAGMFNKPVTYTSEDTDEVSQRWRSSDYPTTHSLESYINTP